MAERSEHSRNETSCQRKCVYFLIFQFAMEREPIKRRKLRKKRSPGGVQDTGCMRQVHTLCKSLCLPKRGSCILSCPPPTPEDWKKITEIALQLSLRPSRECNFTISLMILAKESCHVYRQRKLAINKTRRQRKNQVYAQQRSLQRCEVCGS